MTEPTPASPLRWLVLLLALPPVALAYAAAIGLGLHRHAPALAVSGAATALVFLPPLAISVVASRRRLLAFGTSALVWSLVGLLLLPVYFPGERSDAIVTGLALFLGEADMAASIAGSLPAELGVAEPELAVAAEVQEPHLPPARVIEAHEIVLPYEGAGRNLAIPVVFEHDGVEQELNMMLDTGATYTTLSTETLASFGIEPGDDDPVIVLRTANGEREAHIVVLDRVWLGDLPIDGVAIATCDACSSNATAGLLGLNVAGGFNTTIDADRREIVFSQRQSFDRKLDIKPFLDLGASFSRYPGGRVEVSIELGNNGSRDVSASAAGVRCGERRWSVDLGPIESGETLTRKRKLPRHDACEAYRIELEKAAW